MTKREVHFSPAKSLMLRAAERPDDLAIIEGPIELTYQQFANRVAQFEVALRGLGIAPLTIVGIETPERWVHWAFILACEIIGAPTISFSSPQILDPSNPIVTRCPRAARSVPKFALAKRSLTMATGAA